MASAQGIHRRWIKRELGRTKETGPSGAFDAQSSSHETACHLDTARRISLKCKEKQPMLHLTCKEASYTHLPHTLPAPTTTHLGDPFSPPNIQTFIP